MPTASINKLLKNQLGAIQTKIREHEKALQSLQKEEKGIQQAAALLGAGRPGRPRRTRAAKTTQTPRVVAKRAGRRRRTDWDKTIQKLPSTFSLDQLAGSSGGKGKSRAYLHQIINRWKKAGVIKSVGRAMYEKVG